MIKTEIREIRAEDTWRIRHKVMWPDKPFDYVKVDNDLEGVHFGFFEENKLVSVVSLFIRANDAQFRKLATLEEHQGRGYAARLIEHLMTYTRRQNVKRIWCNARTNKTAYYSKFGLNETPETFRKGGIEFIIMERCF